MSFDFNNDASNSNATDDALNGAVPAAPEKAVPVVKTKEEKLEAIKAQIERLNQRYDDVLNDRVVTKTAKVVYCPEVGDKVLATIGRNTATSTAKVVEGTVIAVKHPTVDAEGKSVGATQVRVEVGEGFDTQLVTLYPAQLVPVPAADEASAE